MILSVFLSQLSETGHGVVDMEEDLTLGEDWEKVLRDWDGAQRWELTDAPGLCLEAAGWAAERLYRGCQAIVCRDMSPQDLKACLKAPCPEPRNPATDYSVDLAFRFLPDLVAMARRMAQNDPLVGELLDLAAAWPLSSVGIEGLAERRLDVGAFLAHSGLRQLYVDRILATGDASRLREEPIRQAARAALGAFPELAPKIAAALNPAALTA